MKYETERDLFPDSSAISEYHRRHCCDWLPGYLFRSTPLYAPGETAAALPPFLLFLCLGAIMKLNDIVGRKDCRYFVQGVEQWLVVKRMGEETKRK